VKRDDPQWNSHPLYRERMRAENRDEPDDPKPLMARRAFGVIIIGVIAVGTIFTVRLISSLFKEIKKGRRRR
jgi:hypothetical protein